MTATRKQAKISAHLILILECSSVSGTYTGRQTVCFTPRSGYAPSEVALARRARVVCPPDRDPTWCPQTPIRGKWAAFHGSHQTVYSICEPKERYEAEDLDIQKQQKCVWHRADWRWPRRCYEQCATRVASRASKQMARHTAICLPP